MKIHSIVRGWLIYEDSLHCKGWLLYEDLRRCKGWLIYEDSLVGKHTAIYTKGISPLSHILSGIPTPTSLPPQLRSATDNDNDNLRFFI